VTQLLFAPTLARSRHGGASITFTVTRAGRTTFFVLLARRGEHKGGMCLRPAGLAPVAPGLRCTRWVPIGRFARANRVGSNSFLFTGLAGKPLAPGRYTLEAVPSAGGLTGASASAQFTITPTRR
jgi:hypothetical protein